MDGKVLFNSCATTAPEAKKGPGNYTGISISAVKVTIYSLRELMCLSTFMLTLTL